MTKLARTASPRHRVVVVGGGFGGLHVVRALRGAPVEVTVVDRRNYHLFQPLVYQVATGALSPGEIAVPLRQAFKRDTNVRVMLGEVTGFDLAGMRVFFTAVADGPHQAGALDYDSLVVATGASYSYFGHDEWRPVAPTVKGLEDAVEVRRRILTAFEAAEEELDPERKAAWLTFVVVGAGPTGVELAGQIGELARDTLRRDFRAVDTRAARILLVDLTDRVLPQFPPRLSMRAMGGLEALGVTPYLGRTVVAIDSGGVAVTTSSGEAERVPARTVIWAAGVHASELAAALAADADGAEIDRAGRVSVGPDLSLPGHPEVFAIGDMSQAHDVAGRPLVLPGVAPVAIQQGRYVARAIRARLAGEPIGAFRYHDKGNLATIGRERAVADINGVHLSGIVAWVTWLFVHLYYLIGLQNRLLVLIRWTISFLTRGRGARLILSGDRSAALQSTSTGRSGAGADTRSARTGA